MGKHDIPMPISETLEKHYKEQIKMLEAKVRDLDAKLTEEMGRNEQLRFHLETQEKKIEEYRESLVQMTLLATARKQVSA